MPWNSKTQHFEFEGTAEDYDHVFSWPDACPGHIDDNGDGAIYKIGTDGWYWKVDYVYGFPARIYHLMPIPPTLWD